MNETPQAQTEERRCTPHAPHWEPHYHYDCEKCWPDGPPSEDERIWE